MTSFRPPQINSLFHRRSPISAPSSAAMSPFCDGKGERWLEILVLVADVVHVRAFPSVSLSEHSVQRKVWIYFLAENGQHLLHTASSLRSWTLGPALLTWGTLHAIQ